jgi:hypothetical protein
MLEAGIDSPKSLFHAMVLDRWEMHGALVR